MRLPASLLLACLLAAGCAAPADEHEDQDEHAYDGDTFAIDVWEMPSEALAPGANFTITVRSDSEQTAITDHFGAHFWNVTQTDPAAALPLATACGHTGGVVPTSTQSLCQAPSQPGTYYLRGHLRITEQGRAHNWWSTERTFTVA